MISIGSILLIAQLLILLTVLNLFVQHYHLERWLDEIYKEGKRSSKRRVRIDLRGKSISSDETKGNLTMKTMDDFDWMSYIEFYVDLQLHNVTTRIQAIDHYLNFGQFEGRIYPRYNLHKPNQANAIEKLSKFINDHSYLSFSQNSHLKENIPKQILVIYNVESGDFSDFAYNNIQLFLSSIEPYLKPQRTPGQSNNSQSAHPLQLKQTAFFWINVAPTMRTYRLEMFARRYRNIDVVHWDSSRSSFFSHLRVLRLLQSLIEIKFDSVVLLSNSLRGPYTNSSDWLSMYLPPYDVTDYLMATNADCRAEVKDTNHGEAKGEGPMENKTKRVLTMKLDGLSMSKTMITAFLSHYQKAESLFYSFSEEEMNAFFSSFSPPLHRFFIIDEKAVHLDEADKILCSPLHEDSLLFSSSPSPLRLSNAAMKSLKLRTPEISQGGSFYHLNKQFQKEINIPQSQESLLHKTRSTSNCSGSFTSTSSVYEVKREDTVCLLIRSSSMHDQPAPSYNPYDQAEFTGIRDIISSLQRQTNPHWKAFFFITDNQFHFDGRLQQILLKEFPQDHRLQYLHVPPSHRPQYIQYTREDAGYTATDKALQLLLQDHATECDWISITNADNIYGSMVIDQVLQATKEENLDDVSILLHPIDSRNFYNQDLVNRHLHHIWSQRCLEIESIYTLQLYGFTVQPQPALGKVDLAAIFFRAKQLQHLLSISTCPADRAFFGQFMDYRRYPCIGCHDGYFIEHVISYYEWKYHILPLVNLSTIIFHGPSVLWCIAAGGVWLDHRDINEARCFSRATVDRLRAADRPIQLSLTQRIKLAFSHKLSLLIPHPLSSSHSLSAQLNQFDWTAFDQSRAKICFRMNELSFILSK